MDNQLQNEWVMDVWAVMYGTAVRSLWATREDAEQEEARMRKLFPMQNRWAMLRMPVRRMKPVVQMPEEEFNRLLKEAMGESE